VGVGLERVPCEENCETVYGPEPTGFASVYLPGSPTLLQIDCGTMYVWAAMFCRLAY
jgi:hypothetical protein